MAQFNTIFLTIFRSSLNQTSP